MQASPSPVQGFRHHALRRRHGLDRSRLKTSVWLLDVKVSCWTRHLFSAARLGTAKTVVGAPAKNHRAFSDSDSYSLLFPAFFAPIALSFWLGAVGVAVIPTS